MLLVGMAVLIALRLVYSRTPVRNNDQVYLTLRVIGWVLISMSVLVVLQILMGLLFGLLFWGVALVAIGNMLQRYQQAEKNALLWMLTIAAERQLPLVPAIEAFADEWQGTFGRRVRTLAEALRSGIPLPDALDRQRTLVSRRACTAARVGVESGMLGPALREAVWTHNAQEPIWHALAARLYYLLCVLFLGQAVVVGSVVYVAPRFQRILQDFNTPSSAVTRWLFDMMDSYVLFNGLVVMMFAQLFLLSYLLLHFLGWIPWELPLVDRLMRRMDQALVLRSLAWMTERERPMSAAILAVARSYHKGWIRRRLRRADLDMSKGVDWCSALRAQGLIDATQAAVLSSAQRAGNLTWALREMAAGSERRLAWRLQSLIVLIYPLVIIAIGIPTFFFVAGFLTPLASMIERMIG
jgi:protein transport protein HofC